MRRGAKPREEVDRPLEFPKQSLTTFHGVFGPNSKLRPFVVRIQPRPAP